MKNPQNDRILILNVVHLSGAGHYVVNGKMILGFALVAWPAEYGNSGIMTFIVNQEDTVYPKDLGPDTAIIADALEKYDSYST